MGGTGKQGKACLIRDSRLRNEIIKCLKRNNKDLQNFTKNDIKELTDPENYLFCMSSGVPMYSLKMIRSIADPVQITCKDGVKRFYDRENNHHIEILEDLKTGKWTNHCWDMFRVARRVRPPKGLPHLPIVIGRCLDKLRNQGVLEERLKAIYPELNLSKFYHGKKFVMSLAIGETVYLQDPKTKRSDYFVVFKIEAKKIHFVRHNDARPSKEKNGIPARETFSWSAKQLCQFCPESGIKPYKVHISPLGEIYRIDD